MYNSKLFEISSNITFTNGKATVDLGITPLKDTVILMFPATDLAMAARCVEVKANVRTVTLLSYNNGGNPVDGTYWISLFGYIMY